MQTPIHTHLKTLVCLLILSIALLYAANTNAQTLYAKGYHVDSSMESVVDFIKTKDGGYAIFGRLEQERPVDINNPSVGTEKESYFSGQYFLKLDASENPDTLIRTGCIDKSYYASSGSFFYDHEYYVRAKELRDSGFAILGHYEHGQIFTECSPTSYCYRAVNHFSLTKTNKYGIPIWKKKLIHNSSIISTPYDIALTLDGGYLVLADAERVKTARDMDDYLVKLDSVCNPVWARQIRPTNTRSVFPRSLLTMPDSGFVICGTVWDTVNQNYSGDRQFGYVMRISKTGDILWYKKYKPVNPVTGNTDINFYLNQIVLLSDGNLLMQGAMSYDFDQGYLKAIYGGVRSAVVLTKIDTDGNILWQEAYSGSNLLELRDLLDDQYQTLIKNMVPDNDCGFLWARTIYPGKQEVPYSTHNGTNPVPKNPYDIGIYKFDALGNSADCLENSTFPVLVNPGPLISVPVDTSGFIIKTELPTVSDINYIRIPTKLYDTVHCTKPFSYDFGVSDTNLCLGDKANYYLNFDSVCKTIDSIQWIFNGATPGSLTSFTPHDIEYNIAAGEHSVIAYFYDGGVIVDTVEKQVKVWDNNPVITGAPKICSETNISLTVTGSAYYWWMKNGFSEDSINVYYEPIIQKPFSNTILLEKGIDTIWLVGGTGTCRDSTYHVVEALGPQAVTLVGSDVCETDSNTNLTITLSDTSYMNQLIWNTGANGYSITVPTPQDSAMYSIDVINTYCTDTVSDTITIHALAQDMIQITGGDTICAGSPIALLAEPLKHNKKYLWSTGDSAATIIIAPDKDTMITVLLNNNNPCGQAKDTTYVYVYPGSVPNRYDTTVLLGNRIELQGSNGITYAWSPSKGLSCDTCHNPTASPTDTTIYQVIIRDKNGCIRIDTFVVNVEDINVKLFIANAFSPDAVDNTNSKYGIENSAVVAYHLIIYGRNGEKLFETKDMNKNWDGTSAEGLTMSAGVYAYQIAATVMSLEGDKSYTWKGNVTLVR
jgi:hypothetical protein